VKLAEVFTEIIDRGKLLIDELAKLGSPFVIRTKEAQV
jgi:hypothetical protein